MSEIKNDEIFTMTKANISLYKNSKKKQAKPPSDYLVWSVISCVVFFPMGLFGIYLSLDAKRKVNQGHFELAKISSKNALKVNILAIILCVLFGAFIFSNCCLTYVRDGVWIKVKLPSASYPDKT
jgi:hypothetical protein